MAKSWSKVGFKSAIGVLDGDDRLVDLEHLSYVVSSLSLQEVVSKAAKELGKMLSAATDKIWPNLANLARCGNGFKKTNILELLKACVLREAVCKMLCAISSQVSRPKAAIKLGEILSAAADKIWPNLRLYYNFSIPD